MDSNRSHLSSHSKKSSLTRARNAAAGKLSAPGDKEFAEYDLIERQLMADQEKELEYLNGLDQPINKADLPLLCPDENHNGPPMNEPMKLRYFSNAYIRVYTSLIYALNAFYVVFTLSYVFYAYNTNLHAYITCKILV